MTSSLIIEGPGIRTESDHKIALDRATELMDAEPGTRAGFELDGLARAIKEYEDRTL